MHIGGACKRDQSITKLKHRPKRHDLALFRAGAVAHASQIHQLTKLQNHQITKSPNPPRDTISTVFHDFSLDDGSSVAARAAGAGPGARFAAAQPDLLGA